MSSGPFRVMQGVNPCCIPSRARAEMLAESVKLSSERIVAKSGSTADMIALDGGWFLMGTEDHEGFKADGEGPVRRVRVDPFLMDRTQVTNDQFREFVKATGYRTEAEAFGWSFVFQTHIPLEARPVVVDQRVPGVEWWCKVTGADWAHPYGPDTGIADRLNHPAVHISWSDAVAYAQWAGKRLPTEAEWEYASRGGFEQYKYPWGDELTPGGRYLCNTWQGTFPDVDLAEDGWHGTSPVDAFPPNGYGLFGITGNAWEWCQDWFSPDWHVVSTRENPTGPAQGEQRLMKGGSYLCHKSYCNRYRVAARTKNTPDSATTNIGFRCVRDAA